MGSTSDNPIDGAILFGSGDVFALRLPVIIGEEVLVGDSVHTYVSWGFDGGSDEVGFMAFGVGGEREEKFLRLVEGFLNGNRSESTRLNSSHGGISRMPSSA